MAQNAKIVSPARQLATKVVLCDGDLTVWVLTHITKQSGLMHNNLAGQLLPKEQWFVSSNQYVDIASCVVDVELAELEEGKELSIEARAFDIWFTAKSSDYLQDYTLFMEIMPHAFIVVLHKTVYVATRPKLPKAPEVTQEKVPRINDPLEPSGSASTKKRTRKRSKSTS